MTKGKSQNNIAFMGRGQKPGQTKRPRDKHGRYLTKKAEQALETVLNDEGAMQVLERDWGLLRKDIITTIKEKHTKESVEKDAFDRAFMDAMDGAVGKNIADKLISLAGQDSKEGIAAARLLHQIRQDLKDKYKAEFSFSVERETEIAEKYLDELKSSGDYDTAVKVISGFIRFKEQLHAESL